VADGSGVLDMAAVHQAALASLVANSTDAAADFFRELLSPFEMMLRGYIEANTELRQINEALLREREAVLAANRDLESFSYSVSHDLRAPLRAMAGFSAALDEAETGPLNPTQHEYVTRIRDNAAIMSRLIQALLELSRVARADVARARVDLTALGRDVAGKLHHADPERNVELVVQDSLVVDADPRLLRVVVENLLGNAWKFTSKRPTAQIELGVLPTAPEVTYFVRDDGAGFDMAYATHLFGAFARLHSANDFEGTGIGLATVHRIIRRHHGKIWAESHPDQGATFFFTLCAA
jgi:light-regulated signal transduction histidine kinase (bacteriophytochrome)